jgi:hypothetical protein
MIVASTSSMARTRSTLATIGNECSLTTVAGTTTSSSMVCAATKQCQTVPHTSKSQLARQPGLQHAGDRCECLSRQVLTLGLLMGNQQQQSLARRRASPAACRAGASGSDRFTSFVLNITLWRLLSLAGLPLRQIVSWYVFTGRSCWALVVDLQRWLWRAVGWLSAPPRTAALQRFGSPLVDVRRWHYGVGESLPPRSFSDAFHLDACSRSGRCAPRRAIVAAPCLGPGPSVVGVVSALVLHSAAAASPQRYHCLTTVRMLAWDCAAGACRR